jgi:hypothetical protein
MTKLTVAFRNFAKASKTKRLTSTLIPYNHQNNILQGANFVLRDLTSKPTSSRRSLSILRFYDARLNVP